jgi:hypothetical protein
MKQSFVTINNQGFPIYTSHLAFNNSIKSGDSDEFGNTLIEMPSDMSDDIVLDQCVYSFEKRKLIHLGQKPSNYHTRNAELGMWVYDIEVAKAEVSKQIRELCRKKVTEGFLSKALGSEFAYPYSLVDQQNINNAVISSMLDADSVTPFWCRDTSGSWVYADHTAVQIQQVSKDGKNHLSKQLVRNAELQTLIEDAKTEKDINAIVW